MDILPKFQRTACLNLRLLHRMIVVISAPCTYWIFFSVKQTPEILTWVLNGLCHELCVCKFFQFVITMLTDAHLLTGCITMDSVTMSRIELWLGSKQRFLFSLFFSFSFSLYLEKVFNLRFQWLFGSISVSHDAHTLPLFRISEKWTTF